MTRQSIQLTQDVDTAVTELKVKETEDKNKRKERQDLRIQIAEIGHNLSDLRRTKKSVLNVYDKNMPAVVTEIANRRRDFIEMPIGPLGTFVTLEKEEWGYIAENVFGRSLNGFLVTSYDDRNKLQEILQSKGWYTNSPFMKSNN